MSIVECLPWIIVLGGVSCAFLGCEARGPESEGQGNYILEGEVFLLVDRRDADYEYVYAFAGNGVFALRHLFPAPYGHDVGHWFKLAPLPQSLALAVKELRGKESIADQNVATGDWWFRRVTFPPEDKLSQQVTYFANDDAQWDALMFELRDIVIRERNRVLEVPEWAKKDKRILIWLLPEPEREAEMRRFYKPP